VYISKAAIKKRISFMGGFMDRILRHANFGRLEDFIKTAKTGVTVNASIDLQKQSVIQKIYPDEMQGESEMYLLSAIFTFKYGNEERRVSKVYLLGSAGETSEDSRVHTNITNARLKEDYKRLKKANISIEEKFF
jgi:hypothetical protein